MKKVENLKRKIIQFLVDHESFEKTYNRGIDYYTKKKYKDALECFKAAEIKPNARPQVYYNLALSHQCLKNMDLAKIMYKKFLELKPDDYDGLYNLALIYYMQDKFEKAISLYEKCIEQKRDEDGVKALTLAYLSAGQLDKANEFADKILKTEDDENLYYIIAKTFESKNTIGKEPTFINKAIDMYIKILQKAKESFNILMSISIAYAKKGDWENSVIYCQQALDINPDSYDANNQMGLVHYCNNNIAESIVFYEKALKLNPDNDYKIYSNLAYAYEKNEEIDKAIKLFKKMMTKFPKYPAKEELKNHIRILKDL